MSAVNRREITDGVLFERNGLVHDGVNGIALCGHTGKTAVPVSVAQIIVYHLVRCDVCYPLIPKAQS